MSSILRLDSSGWTKKTCKKWNKHARTWPAQIKNTKTVEMLSNCKPRREEMQGSADKRSLEAFEKLNAYKINKKMKAQNTIQNMMMKIVLRVTLVVCLGICLMVRLTLKKE